MSSACDFNHRWLVVKRSKVAHICSTVCLSRAMKSLSTRTLREQMQMRTREVSLQLHPFNAITPLYFWRYLNPLSALVILFTTLPLIVGVKSGAIIGNEWCSLMMMAMDTSFIKNKKDERNDLSRLIYWYRLPTGEHKEDAPLDDKLTLWALVTTLLSWYDVFMSVTLLLRAM